jgi:hypothetical protein
MVTRAHLETVLQAAGEQYAVLPLQGEASALITRRGGRVLGIFPTPESDNLLWTNDDAFASPAHFEAFVKAGKWNLGGERIWIAPEIQYNVRDRRDFWGTLSVPPQMDPGEYQLTNGTRQEKHPFVALGNEITLSAYNLGEGEQKIWLSRLYTPVTNPLRSIIQQESWLQDVVYCGYQQDVALDGEQTNAYSEAWNLVQVIAGGQLLIPCAPVVEASDYFGSVPEEARQLHQGDMPHLRLSLTGQRQYKIGYKVFSMTGRMGYWRTLPDGRESVLIRSFFNNPSNLYAEEPPDLPGVNGHSVHVYNDGGEFGGAQSFGEMECTGTTIRGDLRSTADDSFVMWVYVGEAQAIRRIIHLLLGVRL